MSTPIEARRIHGLDHAAARRRLTRFAVALGAVSIALAIVVGWFAYTTSRYSITDGYFQSHLLRTQARAAMLDNSDAEALDESVLKATERLYQNAPQRFPGVYMCVMGNDGRLLMHTRDPSQVGLQVGSQPFRGSAKNAPENLQQLVREKRDWVGLYESLDGEQQVIACVYLKRFEALLDVHMPWAPVSAEVDRSNLPWAVGLALIALIFLPLCVGLLHRAYSASDRATRRAEQDLRESEARLHTAIESLPFDLVVTDRDGRCVLQNAASVRRTGQWIGKSPSEAGLAPKIAAEFEENSRLALAVGEVRRDFEDVQAGRRASYQSIVAPVRDGERTIGAVGVHIDVTERKRTEEELALALRRLTFHVENSPLGVIEWDRDVRVARWSAGAERIFGWKSAEVLGKHPGEWPFVHREDREAVKAVIERLVEGREPHNTSLNRNYTKSGDVIHCEWHNSVLRDETGELVSVLSLVLDVTQRKLAMDLQSIHQSVLEDIIRRRPLGEILDHIVRRIEVLVPEMLGSVLLVDPSGKYLLPGAAPSLPAEYVRALDRVEIGPWSGSCGTACHRKERVIVGDISVDPLWTSYRDLALPSGLRACWSQPIMSGSGEPLGAFAMYYRVPRQPRASEIYVIEGAARLVEIAIESRRTEDANLRLNRRLQALHAIDAAILAEGSLEEVAGTALKRILDFVAYVRASVALIDEAANECLLCAVESRLPTRIGVGVRAPLEASRLASVDDLRAGRHHTVEDLEKIESRPPMLEALLAEGVRAYVVMPMLTQGNLVGTLNICLDHTGSLSDEDLALVREIADLVAVAVHQARLDEQLRAQAAELENRVLERTAELTEVNEELESYVRSVSHDLRAPLRAIQGLGMALKEDFAAELEAPAREYMERMVSAAERMDQLMQDLLVYSRLGRTQLHLQVADMPAVVREAQELVAQELLERRARVEVEDPLLPMAGHTPTLIQVVSNLLSNAGKFVPAGREPRIRVLTERKGENVRLWVEDNGIGVPREHHERIFHVFERLHGAETYPGTGIGLAIVRRAVERMGGRSGVESRPGEGSRFWIELPARRLPT